MKRLFLFLCILALAIGLVSCKVGGGGTSPDDQGGGNTDVPDNYLYAPGSELWMLYPENLAKGTLDGFVRAIEDVRGEFVNLTASPSEKHENEIVIGKSDREVSRRAYMYLNRQDKDDPDMAGYVIFSDGSSVAIAYDEDVFDTGIALASAINRFVESYVSGETLELKVGVLANEQFNLIEYQRAIDAEKREMSWNNLRANLMMGASLSAYEADNIITALRDYYTVYDPDVLMWLADLYDKDIGGFYYSNSGRNTIGYGPDIESTRQALTLLESSGIFGGKSLGAALPDWMGDQIGRWVKGLQREDGFFYHPQWAIEEHTSSRLSRDLGQALSLLSYFGYRPTYNTVYGDIGDGLLADGTPVGARSTGRLGGSVVSRVSAIVSASAAGYPDHLQTPEAFRKYLEEKILINEDPYRMANQLATQVGVIISRGTEYKNILIDFLNSKQNPKTGFWTLDSIAYEDRDWEGINCFLKLSDVYNQCGAPIRNAMKVAESCFDVLMTADLRTFGSVCFVYNPWYAIENIRDNIMKCSGGDMTEYNALRQRILARAPEAIARTKECIQLFMKEDKSASFGQTSTASTSVGMRVAVHGTNEGDVNATLINLFGSLNHLMGVLGYEPVKPFGKAEYMMFIRRIEGLGTIIKDEVANVEPITFDGDTVGEKYVDFSYSFKSSGSAYVAVRPDGEGKALLIDSENDGNDNVMFPSATPSLTSNKFYFEADLCATKAGGTFAQITFHPYVYMLSLHVDDFDGDGVRDDVRLTEDSYASWSTSISNTVGTVAKLGEWFNLKMEYYIGSHDEVRCLVYVNGELVLISTNYYGRSLVNESQPETYCESARISIISGSEVDLYVDNVVMNKTGDSYVKPTKFPENMVVNVDAPEREEKRYGFADGIPEDITVAEGSGGVKVTEDENKALNISGVGSSLTIPVNIRKPLSNCGIFEADFTVDKSTAENSTYEITYLGRNASREPMVRLRLVTKGTGDEGYTTVAMAHTGVTGKLIDDIKIPHGEAFRLRVEYYQGEKTVLIYVNNRLIATSDLLCGRANVNEFGYLVFSSVSAAATSAITLDNIIVEQNYVSFANATRPTVDEKVYEFDGSDIPSDITVSGAAVSDGRLSISGSSSGYIKIPVNKRSVIRSALEFKTLLDTSYMSDGSMFEIKVTDGDGKTVLSFSFVVEGSKINIFEETENNSYTTPAGSFRKGTSTLSLNYNFAKEIITVGIDGKAVAISSVTYSEGASGLSCDYVVISALRRASLSIDNTVAESYNMLYKASTVSYSNSETGADIYTFDTSSTGSIPASITKKLVSANAATKVKEMLVDGRFTKVLAFQTSPGGNDSLTIPITRDERGKNGVALEMYLKTDVAFDVFFKSGDTTVTGFYIAGGEICDYKNSKYTFSIKSVDTKKWHKYRFEYTLTNYDYDNDGENDIAMKVYVDGALTATGYHTWAESTAPASSISSVMLYTHSAGEGEVCLDNLLLERCNVTVDPPAVRPPDLSDQPITAEDTVPGAYYEKIALTGKQLGLDYTGKSFWSLCVRNAAASYKALDISNQMNDYKSSTYVSVTTLDGDSVLMIAKEPTNHQVPEVAFYNLNKADGNCVVFESKVMISLQNSDQITADGIYFSRFGFVSEYNRGDNYSGVKTTSKMLNIAEAYGSFDPSSDKWGEIKYGTKTLDPTAWYVITMEYYRSEGVICYYIDGELISTVGVGVDLDCNNVVFQLQGQAHGSAIYFDNTYFGSVDKEFLGELPEIPHVHTYSEALTFDEANHWYAATCTDKDTCATAKKDVTAHSYDAAGLCVCGFENPNKDNPGPQITPNSYYYKNVINGGEKGFDYTNKSFWALCVRNGSASAPFIENTDAMNADLHSNKHAEVDKSLPEDNHALKIGNVGGSHAIPQIQFNNLNSADKNCFVFETDIQFNIGATSQVTASNQYFARISVLDTFGDRVQANTNGYMPTVSGNPYWFELGGEFDTENDVWKSVSVNGFAIESGKWYKMTVEYYKSEGVMLLYLDGELISTKTGLDAEFTPVAGVIQLQGQAYGSTIYIDNTYVGTVDKNYTEE